MMKGARATVLDAIGHTPIVKLNKVAAHVKSDIYVKLEYLNPGGSMKDRVALNIIRDAERRGLLGPGSTIIEATSGNTGAGLALVAAIRGYKCIFVMPDKMSNEKIAALRAFGAKVVICPTAVEPEDPRSYYEVTKRIVKDTPNSFHSNQYYNPANPEAHYLSTGPGDLGADRRRDRRLRRRHGHGRHHLGLRQATSRRRSRASRWSASIRSARSTTSTSRPGASPSRSPTTSRASARTSCPAR